MAKPDKELLTIGGREIAITNPQKILFPEAGYTKQDLVDYYLAVADGALAGSGGRPNVLVRYPNGTGGEFFYQKRAPESRPEWIEVVGAHGMRMQLQAGEVRHPQQRRRVARHDFFRRAS